MFLLYALHFLFPPRAELSCSYRLRFRLMLLGLTGTLQVQRHFVYGIILVYR